MSKHIVSLVLVLALAAMASAVQWVGPAASDPQGAWEDTSNWDTGALPAWTDTATIIARSDGTGSNVTVSSTVVAKKPQMKYSNGLHMKLEILSTGVLNSDGSFEQGKGLMSTVTIDAGGVINACQKTTTTVASYKLSSAAGGLDVINIYGTLNVKNNGTLTTVGSQIYVGQNAGTGYGRIYVYDGGLLDVDTYAINGGFTSQVGSDTKRGMIQINNGGIMKIKGDVLAQVNADIAAGNIVNGFGTTEDVIAWTAVLGFQKYTFVPEPATIALLGLGSLTLLRRKR